jgi:hypothetical protein
MITNKELDLFIRLFGYVPPRLKDDKLVVAHLIIAQYKIPARYLAGLDDKDKFARQIELVSKKRQTPKERRVPLKTDKIAQKEKTGSCTKKFAKLFPDLKTNLQKSRVTGIPKRILDKVLNKGQGAFYSSGSRLGQTAVSWGIARVNCFIMGKKTVIAGPDKDLYEEALKYAKAKKWFAK